MASSRKTGRFRLCDGRQRFVSSQMTGRFMSCDGRLGFVSSQMTGQFSFRHTQSHLLAFDVSRTGIRAVAHDVGPVCRVTHGKVLWVFEQALRRRSPGMYFPWCTLAHVSRQKREVARCTNDKELATQEPGCCQFRPANSTGWLSARYLCRDARPMSYLFELAFGL